jgi:hypothetical protein
MAGPPAWARKRNSQCRNRAQATPAVRTLTDPPSICARPTPQGPQRQLQVGTLIAWSWRRGTDSAEWADNSPNLTNACTFLDKAEHLFNDGYRHAPASLADAVLEGGLCRELTARGVKATGNLESMNQSFWDGSYRRAGREDPPMYEGARDVLKQRSATSRSLG